MWHNRKMNHNHFLGLYNNWINDVISKLHASFERLLISQNWRVYFKSGNSSLTPNDNEVHRASRCCMFALDILIHENTLKQSHLLLSVISGTSDMD